MESRLGHDFSDVRVHTDSKAHDSAQAVNAHAYTLDFCTLLRAGGVTVADGVGT